MKRKNAQQLVEFLLIAPFIIGFLAFFTEYAFALNINLTLTKALKASTSKLYQYARANMTQDEISKYVSEDFVATLEENGVSVKDKNKVKVGFFTKNNVGIFMATYTYYPAFSLPNIFFNIMPEKFSFMTTVPVPISLLKSNNYNNAKTSDELDKIWNANTFSNQSSYDGIKNGALNTDTGRGKILFLFPTTEYSSEESQYYIMNWDGIPISISKDVTVDETSTTQTFYKIYSKNKNKLLECSAIDKSCSETSQDLYSYISNNSKTYIYVIPKESILGSSDSAENIKKAWLYNSSSSLDASSITDISATNIFGTLKNSIAIINKTASAIGNYDNISISGNSDGSSSANSNAMNIYPFGSMIFIDSSSSIRDNVTSGKSRPNFSGFGG